MIRQGSRTLTRYVSTVFSTCANKDHHNDDEAASSIMEPLHLENMSQDNYGSEDIGTRFCLKSYAVWNATRAKPNNHWPPQAPAYRPTLYYI